LVEKTENRETEINKTNEPCKGGYGGRTGHFLGGSFANKIIWIEAQIHRPGELTIWTSETVCITGELTIWTSETVCMSAGDCVRDEQQGAIGLRARVSGY
jgi:hypothetical protein